MGRRPYPRSLLPRHSSWLLGVGIRHGNRRWVFGGGGQQHRWRRITGTCIGNQRVGNRGVRPPFGLLCGRAVTIQSCRKPKYCDLGAARREIASILTKGLADGDVAGPDRSYVAQVIAARTGLSQADADKRVSNVIDQAKTDLDNARRPRPSCLCGSPRRCLSAPLLPVWQLREAEKSGIITRVLPADR